METLNQRIRQFNRFEFKYLVSLKQAQAVKAVVRKYMSPDIYGNQDGRYAIANMYYDSPDYRCYWEKEAGIKFRRKLRIRHYETGNMLTEEAPIFLEIKQRIDRVTQKRRAVLSYKDALCLCNDRKFPERDTQDQALLDEIYVMVWRYHLTPSMIVRYNRQAFIGSIYDVGMRVTFDTDLSFQAHPLRLHEEKSQLPFQPADQVILEVKVNERMPHWLTELVASQNMKMYRISKYCSSVDAAWKLPGFGYRSPFSEGVRETFSSAYSIPVFWERLSQSQKNQR